MALNLIPNTNSSLTVSSQWGELVTRSGKNMLGVGLSIPIFTLTNWDASTTQPQIAQGSIVEVGGSFYQADSDTALVDDGGLANGTVHIKLDPAVDLQTVSPILTNDSIPTWDATKSGWYTTDNKFLPFEMTKTGAVFTLKNDIVHQSGAKAVFPVGHVYTQYPTKKTPSELGFHGTWTNISSAFPGDFFRSEGGAASSFGSGQQAFSTDLKSHIHTTDVGSHAHDINIDGGGTGANLVAASNGAVVSQIPTAGIAASATIGNKDSGTPSNTGDAETRPVNRTIRLWERTA